MPQRKIASFLEAMLDTASGLAFSFIIQLCLNEAYDVDMSYEVAFWFVFWFTIASLVRKYIIRRLATVYDHKVNRFIDLMKEMFSVYQRKK